MLKQQEGPWAQSGIRWLTHDSEVCQTSMSEATRRRRAQRLHTRVCLDAALWQAKCQALVFRTIQTIDPMGSEILARLQAIVPAIAIQVTEAFGNDNPCHSAAGLLKPEQHLMHTAAKHEYSKPFSQLNPMLVRTLRRGRTKQELAPPPPPPTPDLPCDDERNTSRLLMPCRCEH